MSSTPKRADTAGLVIAGFLLILAGIVWWDMTSLQLTSVYGLGPEAMPIVVATGLVLLAIGNGVVAIRGETKHEEPGDFRALLLILGGLAALMLLIHFGGGFILATAVLFTATAAAFGRRALLVDFIIGLVLGTVAYLLFARLLTLSLPVGPLERLL